MQHREIRKVLAERISSLLATSEGLPVTLRPYQVEALRRTQAWLADAAGTPRAYIEHATGLGKTILFSSLVGAAPELRSLVIVPTRVLVEQTIRVLTQFTGGLVGHFSSLDKIRNGDGEIVATRGFEHHGVVVTTDASFKRFAKKLAEGFKPHLIIRDECHWGYLKTVQDALGLFPDAVIIGVSATPDFLTTVKKWDSIPVTLENGQVLYAPKDRLARTHFGACLDQRQARWGIEEGWLAPLAWGMIEFQTNLDSVPIREGPVGPDYDDAALAKLMTKHWSVMSQTILKLYEHGEYDLPNRQVFAVCPTIWTASRLAKAIHDLGIPAACITGDTSTEERNAIFAAYRYNHLRFLSSVMVLREGWDAPNAEVCMMLRPTKSRVLYQQCMGRVLRPAPDGGYKTALVLDAHFQNTTFTPLSAPELFGKPGERVRIGGILVGPRAGKEIILPQSHAPLLPEEAQPRIVVVDAFQMEYWAGPDGTFEAEGETWGTVTGFASILQISAPAIRSRLCDRVIPVRKGKAINNRCRDFYPLSKIKEACADLLEELSKAGPDGTFEAEGETWGTPQALSTILPLSSPTIRSRVEEKKVNPKDGRDKSGSVASFYPLSKVKEACADLLEELPKAGSDGTFEADGETWGTELALAHLLRISRVAIVGRLKHTYVRFKMGRYRSGKGAALHRAIFYALADVKEACADLLEELSKAGPDGTFEADGETWGTVNAIARILSCSFHPVALRIQTAGVEPRNGKDYYGHRKSFYPLSKVKEACADLLKKRSASGGKGEGV